MAVTVEVSSTPPTFTTDRDRFEAREHVEYEWWSWQSESRPLAVPAVEEGLTGFVAQESQGQRCEARRRTPLGDKVELHADEQDLRSVDLKLLLGDHGEIRSTLAPCSIWLAGWRA